MSVLSQDGEWEKEYRQAGRQAATRFFLPLRDGGDGFVSALRSNKAAFAESLAQMISHEILNDADRKKWEGLQMFKIAIQEVKEES